MKFNPKKLAMKGINGVGNLILSPPYGGFGYFNNHGPRDQRKIALTFDDGPSRPCTQILLDVMSELNVKGTFFCVGVNATLHPDLITRMHHEGHAIGNHSMAHRRWSSLKLGNDGHIDQATDIISQIIGCTPRLYRPPWGWLTPWEGRRLAQRHYTIVGWDVYTLDWQLPEPDGNWIADEARRETRPGSILLFHDGIPNTKVWVKEVTIRAIRKLVPALRADGYEFVTIPDLLNIPAYAPLATTPA